MPAKPNHPRWFGLLPLILGALSGAFFVLAVTFDFPLFEDERNGYPGIPGAFAYAIGTSQGVLLFGACVFAAYGLLGGLVFWWLAFIASNVRAR